MGVHFYIMDYLNRRKSLRGNNLGQNGAPREALSPYVATTYDDCPLQISCQYFAQQMSCQNFPDWPLKVFENYLRLPLDIDDNRCIIKE